MLYLHSEQLHQHLQVLQVELELDAQQLREWIKRNPKRAKELDYTNIRDRISFLKS